MIGHSLRPCPSTSGISTSHLRMPSARCPACPFGRSCSGIVWAFPALVVTTKLLAYEVCVYLALCPLHACDSSTSYSYCVCSFCFAGDSLTFSDFYCLPGRAPPFSRPLFLSGHNHDPPSVLPDRVAHQRHRRGLAAVPHLAGRTDVLLTFDRDVAGVGGPGL